MSKVFRRPRRNGNESETPEGDFSLKTRISELEDYCAGLQDLIRPTGIPFPPPPHLQIRVAGIYYPEFFEHGETLLQALERALHANGKDLTSFPTVLDFGCGCGRVLQAFRSRAHPSQVLHGTDIDGEAIAWCQKNCSELAQFSVNPSSPPTEYSDNTFDLVFSVSVFTHLPEDLQFAWLGELQRVTKSGGYLLLTCFSEQYFDQVPAAERAAARGHTFFYDEEGVTTAGLPEFYRQAFHTREYIRSRWSEFFDVLDIRERAVDDHQDIVVCRRR